MFNITDYAIKQFKSALAEAGLSEQGIRLSISSCCGGIGLNATEEGEEGDILIERDQLKIFIDPILYEQLSEMVLDYEDGFVIRHSF